VGLPNKPAIAAGESSGQAQADSETVKTPGAQPQAAAAAELPDADIAAQEPGAEVVVAPPEPSTDSDAESEAVSKDMAKPPAVASITLKSGRPQDVDVSSAPQTAPEGPRYLVQVASFSSEKNANALAARLRESRLPVLMDVVDRTAGRMHRVRVGPYEQRSEADAIVARLKSQMNDLTPRVHDLRPDESSPVSSPSDPLVRWVVQVGSFGSEAAADALVAKLRLAGMSAFSEKVTSGAGTAYKVRVGPELDRDKAVALVGKLKSEHQLDGFVTTQE
jgi:DedD protein